MARFVDLSTTIFSWQESIDGTIIYRYPIIKITLQNTQNKTKFNTSSTITKCLCNNQPMATVLF